MCLVFSLLSERLILLPKLLSNKPLFRQNYTERDRGVETRGLRVSDSQHSNTESETEIRVREERAHSANSATVSSLSLSSERARRTLAGARGQGRARTATNREGEHAQERVARCCLLLFYPPLTDCYWSPSLIVTFSSTDAWLRSARPDAATLRRAGTR